MEVKFRTRRLEKCAKEHKEAIRLFGRQLGLRYMQRIQDIQCCRSIDDFWTFPAFRFHELKGDRKGQSSIRLTGQMRLIVTFPREGVVKVEEVSKHYE